MRNSQVLDRFVYQLRTKRAAVLAAGSLLALGSLFCAESRVCAQPALGMETPEEAKRMADALFSSRFAIDDEAPERKIPSQEDRNKYPVDFGNFLMSLAERADEAVKKGDHAAAAKYFRGVVAAVPDASAGFVKLCTEYEALGEHAKAEAVCGAALQREGVKLDDYAHFVKIVVSQREPLQASQIKQVDDVVAHLRQTMSDLPFPDLLECQLGLRIKDERRLANCTSALAQKAPLDMSTITYSWLLAVMRFDRKAAESWVQRAKEANAEAGVVEWMQSRTHDLQSPLEHRLRQQAPALGLAAFALLVLILVVSQWRRVQHAFRKSSAQVR